jgi:hypothetical protein
MHRRKRSIQVASHAVRSFLYVTWYRDFDVPLSRKLSRSERATELNLSWVSMDYREIPNRRHLSEVTP